MKNLGKLFGIIALIAVIGFGVTSCKEDEGNLFVGIWTGTDTTLTCTDNTWSINNGAFSGNYTYSGNTATLTSGGTGTLTISGNKMNGTFNGSAIPELTKQ